MKVNFYIKLKTYSICRWGILLVPRCEFELTECCGEYGWFRVVFYCAAADQIHGSTCFKNLCQTFQLKPRLLGLFTFLLFLLFLLTFNIPARVRKFFRTHACPNFFERTRARTFPNARVPKLFRTHACANFSERTRAQAFSNARVRQLF